jgi:hypothetical protein
VLARIGFLGARSSAVEHCLDMAVVTGSIPVVPTIFPPRYLLSFLSKRVGCGRIQAYNARHECKRTNYQLN